MQKKAVGNDRPFLYHRKDRVIGVDVGLPTLIFDFTVLTEDNIIYII